MISEQERNESKRRQTQGIKVAKELYSPNAKDSQKRLVYYWVIEMLDKCFSISNIVTEVDVTRQTI